ncbi:DUF883 domain-containing protein [Methylomonas paludis]|uniref:DUF883 domain-containing protein n=1 Tax=Methylomonas paludis TaxID=1173101 RepID=A0A975MKZ5_9GAMM|nr:DUF883 domain-containing protein [Methylomonas paludis]QWF69751.1 DUF883 domain-containing protein [Methylomonas paludis]
MKNKDKASHYAHEAFDKIAGASSKASEVLYDKGEDLKIAEQILRKQCRRYVRDNPITALGIAATAGFLLSQLLKSTLNR